ncbi:MAG: heavy-metal-associated domain-containing protein [Candidatus Omnitrophica bacterium]|nr:heavy-metal-associated domain-containing protein [Candidatus Omnitrophota bacterium]
MRLAFVLVGMLVGSGVIGLEEASAEIEGIQLQVDGLSCPFCALGLDKRLKQRAGLDEIHVHLKQGVTEATLPRGHGIDVGKVRQAVQEAGFTLRGIKLTVIGMISRDGDRMAVTSRHDGTTFLLFDAEHQDTEASATLSQGLRRQLEHAEQAKRLVKISGLVHEHAGLPAGLMIESFEELAE